MTDAPTKKRRWLKPLLAVSLVLNMLIVGVILGFVFANPPGKKNERIDGPARSLVGVPFIRALEPKDRRALGKQIAEDQERLRDNRAALRRQFETLLSAIVAEPFDPEVMQAALAEQREVALRRQAIGERLLIERISQMSVDERTAYAERLAKDLRRLRRE